ncbi:hypothetical protein BS47DRAFT_1365804 [Hydnum rufescens UP504]|uniref:Uncharacterized protein n=1 Tax=Hydnum rufescens UP504 TaxID=1448309 RepID=A0A9P6DN57_9AGAM|nr:hypothetical protein BS47DRAFT_1365804 [Hydnum rufescens UP504]
MILSIIHIVLVAPALGRFLGQVNDHTPTAVGVWLQDQDLVQGTTEAHETMRTRTARAQTTTRHDEPSNDEPNKDAPNKDAPNNSTPNEHPRNHTPAAVGVPKPLRETPRHEPRRMRGTQYEYHTPAPAGVWYLKTPPAKPPAPVYRSKQNPARPLYEKLGTGPYRPRRRNERHNTRYHTPAGADHVTETTRVPERTTPQQRTPPHPREPGPTQTPKRDPARAYEPGPKQTMQGEKGVTPAAAGVIILRYVSSHFAASMQEEQPVAALLGCMGAPLGEPINGPLGCLRGPLTELQGPPRADI